MKKQHLGVALAALAVIAAAVFLYFRLGQDFTWGRFLAVLRNLRPAWILTAVPLILAAYAIRAARWKVMIQPIAPHVTLLQLLSATFIGFTAVVLFGRAGEPVRPFLIARRAKISFSSQVAAWLVERILDLLMILALFGLSLAQLSDVGWAPDSKLHTVLVTAGWIAGLSGAGCLAALVALRRYQGQIRSRLEDALAFLPDAPRYRVNGIIHAFDEGMKCTRDPASLWLLVLSTIVEWVVVAAVFFTTIRAFPALQHLTLSETLTVMGIATFANVVQIPGVGGGMQIAIVLTLSELYAVGVEVASAVALILWAINSVVAVPIGLAWAFHDGIRWRTIKDAAEENSIDPAKM